MSEEPWTPLECGKQKGETGGHVQMRYPSSMHPVRCTLQGPVPEARVVWRRVRQSRGIRAGPVEAAGPRSAGEAAGKTLGKSGDRI